MPPKISGPNPVTWKCYFIRNRGFVDVSEGPGDGKINIITRMGP